MTSICNAGKGDCYEKQWRKQTKKWFWGEVDEFNFGLKGPEFLKEIKKFFEIINY